MESGENHGFDPSAFSNFNLRRVHDGGAEILADEAELPLNEQLFRAQVEWHDENGAHKFLPNTAIQSLVQPHLVRPYLRSAFRGDSKQLSAKLEDSLVRYICGKGQGARRRARKVQETGRKVFAILALIDKPCCISHFLRERIWDVHLPLTPSSRGGCLKTILIQQTSIEVFCQWQWRVLSPFLDGPDDKGKVAFYTLPRGSILPWISRELTAQSMSSHVEKVIIHPAHNGISKGTHLAEIFALKRVSQSKYFAAEVKAIRNAGTHKHIIPLRCTFKFKTHGSYGLLFPWAEGGNLGTYWARVYSPEFLPPKSQHWQWFFRQVFGLSEALGRLHHVEPRSQFDTRTTQHPHGIHGDIKPENILCFIERDGTRVEHELKLADFGYTIFREEGNTGRHPDDVPTSYTHDAPENDYGPSVSRPFDIWSLGCVFVEFSTWMLLGNRGIREFSDARVREDRENASNEANGMIGDQYFTTDGIKPGQQNPMVKKSVGKWIQNLRDNDHGCGPLADLLQYISNKMIVADVDGRDGCDEVIHNMRRFYEEAEKELPISSTSNTADDFDNLWPEMDGDSAERGSHQSTSEENQPSPSSRGPRWKEKLKGVIRCW